MDAFRIIHDFAAWLTVYELQGKLGRIAGEFPKELYDLIVEAQKIDWELKRALHRITLELMDGVDIKTLMDKLNELVEKYKPETF